MGAANYITAIVEFLAKNKEPNKLSEIVNALNIGNSSAFRALKSLNAAQWVARDELTKKYRIGAQLIKIAQLILSQIDLRNISLPYLEILKSKVNESVYASSLIGLERMYIEQVHSSHELQQIVEMGKALPLWQGAPGKAILANLNDSEIETVLNKLKESHISSFASGRPVKLTKLRKELSKAKMKGFILSSGERIAGLNSVAAPIFDHNQRVLGSVSIGGPMARFSMEIATRCAPLVIDTAHKISARLGYSTT